MSAPATHPCDADFTKSFEQRLEDAIGISPLPMTDGEWQSYLEEQEANHD